MFINCPSGLAPSRNMICYIAGLLYHIPGFDYLFVILSLCYVESCTNGLKNSGFSAVCQLWDIFYVTTYQSLNHHHNMLP